jgi:hypothetical protein
MERFLLLPLEEEGWLNDMPLRENFRAGVCRAVPPQANCTIAWTRMLDEEPTVPPSGRPRRRREAQGGLVPVPAVRAGKFHTAHKLSLMAHSTKHYSEMGRLVADAGKRDWDELTAEYGAMLMEGLGVMGTRGKHVNVLQHLMGYLKNHLSNEDKAYLWSVGSFWAS